MKILFFINTMGPGGKERRLAELLKSLKQYDNIESELVIMSKDILYKEVTELGIKIHFLIRKIRFDISAFYRFSQICRNFRPDVVHCWDSMTALYSVPACRFQGIHFVNGMVTNATQRQNIFNKHWLRARLTFPLSDCIVGNSRAGLKSYQAPESKSYVIYNGFNRERLNNLIPGDVIRDQLKINTKYIVGMVATFSGNKDYKTYYKAAQLILNKRKDVTFLAIGNNTDSDQSIGLINKKFSEYFRLTGKISGVESYINVMDICVLITFTEGISNSIMEYMALGKPVIATDGGGTKEIVEDNDTGFLINTSDYEGLAKRINQLLEDQDLRLKMGKAGEKRISERFSINEMAGKYMDIYKNFCK